MKNSSPNFNIHHCRRDLGASGRPSAIKTVQKYLMDEEFAELHQALAHAANSFEETVIKYPPSNDYAMPHDYWNGIWQNQQKDHPTPNQIKEAIIECKSHVEKALRRAQKHLDTEEFSEQEMALYAVLRILEKR